MPTKIQLVRVASHISSHMIQNMTSNHCRPIPCVLFDFKFHIHIENRNGTISEPPKGKAPATIVPYKQILECAKSEEHAPDAIRAKELQNDLIRLRDVTRWLIKHWSSPPPTKSHIEDRSLLAPAKSQIDQLRGIEQNGLEQDIVFHLSTPTPTIKDSLRILDGQVINRGGGHFDSLHLILYELSQDSGCLFYTLDLGYGLKEPWKEKFFGQSLQREAEVHVNMPRESTTLPRIYSPLTPYPAMNTTQDGHKTQHNTMQQVQDVEEMRQMQGRSFGYNSQSPSAMRHSRRFNLQMPNQPPLPSMASDGSAPHRNCQPGPPNSYPLQSSRAHSMIHATQNETWLPSFGQTTRAVATPGSTYAPMQHPNQPDLATMQPSLGHLDTQQMRMTYNQDFVPNRHPQTISTFGTIDQQICQPHSMNMGSAQTGQTIVAPVLEEQPYLRGYADSLGPVSVPQAYVDAGQQQLSRGAAWHGTVNHSGPLGRIENVGAQTWHSQNLQPQNGNHQNATAFPLSVPNQHVNVNVAGYEESSNGPWHAPFREGFPPQTTLQVTESRMEPVNQTGFWPHQNNPSNTSYFQQTYPEAQPLQPSHGTQHNFPQITQPQHLQNDRLL